MTRLTAILLLSVSIALIGLPAVLIALADIEEERY